MILNLITITRFFPCLLTNIQSTHNKFSELLHVVDDYHPKIIAFAKSWCTDSTCNAEIHIPDYIAYRKDRKSRAGGGVLLYIHVSLPTNKPMHSLNNLTFEDHVWCLVTLNTDKIIVGIAYGAPSSALDNDNRILTVLNDLQHFQPHSHLLLVGDFNLPNIDWLNNTVKGGDSTFASQFLMFMLTEHSLEPMHHRPGQPCIHF